METTQGYTTKDTDKSPDIGAITKLERAINETVDIDRLMAFYADDAVLIGPFAPGMYHGAAEIRSDLEQRLAGVSARTLDDIDLNIVTNGTFATAYSQQAISTTGPGGKTEQTSVRAHDVFQKIGGEWKIALQHVSYVADMKKMTAVKDQPFLKRGPVNWTSAPFPEPPVEVAQAETELREWYVDDIHAQVAEQAMRYYGPGDYVTVYDSRVPPGRMVGMWDVYQGWLPEMMLKHVDDTLAEYRCWTDGQFAAIYTVQDIVAEKLDESVMKSQSRQTDCLHRVDGHWYSFIEAVSWPVEAATGKIIVNLAETKPA